MNYNESERIAHQQAGAIDQMLRGYGLGFVAMLTEALGRAPGPDELGPLHQHVGVPAIEHAVQLHAIGRLTRAIEQKAG